MLKKKFYLHSSKDDNAEYGREMGLQGEALQNFRYAGYEVELDVEIDKETGNCYALTINGVKLGQRVKI